MRWCKIITNAILILLGSFLVLISSLIPGSAFLDSLISAKDSISMIGSQYIPYALYLFDVPMLCTALALLTGYLLYIPTEYATKLLIKYATRLL